MRTLAVLSVLLVSGSLFLAPVLAQTSASHTVTMGISPISVIAVSGDPIPLIIQRGTPFDTDEVIDATTFYNLTTNMPDVIISARLDSPMPGGTRLFLAAESALGNGAGETRLSMSSRNLVTSIDRGLENGRMLQYRFDTSRSTGAVPLQSRRVTISITDESSGTSQEVYQYVQFGVEEAFPSQPTN